MILTIEDISEAEILCYNEATHGSLSYELSQGPYLCKEWKICSCSLTDQEVDPSNEKFNCMRISLPAPNARNISPNISAGRLHDKSLILNVPTKVLATF